MQITLAHVTKRFGKVTAVKDLNLEIRSGEFMALLGPSGCGKTTTLLMLAGIYKPSEGEIRFNDRVVNDLLPAERNIGMVFQSYALYPHMTVYQNISYPLRLKRLPKSEIDSRVRQVAEMLEIAHLLDRKPAQLSGGQQQRVGVGRALVKEPDVLLFDEPLSNLDARLRFTMRSELKHLQQELGITSVYVTHDQVEAMTMADRIAVMNESRVIACGSPEELYDRPQNLFVAGFIGNPPMNLVEATLKRLDGEGKTLFRLCCSDLEVTIPEEIARKALQGNNQRQVIFGIRPEDLYIEGEAYPADCQLGDPITSQISVVEPLGREILLECRSGKIVLDVLTGSGKMGASFEHTWRTGTGLRFRPDLRKLHLFDPATGQSLLHDKAVRN